LSIAPSKDALNKLAKDMLLPLKAVVLALAILSPMVLIALALALSPEIPAKSEEIILYLHSV
jgi:hypothetical protein